MTAAWSTEALRIAFQLGAYAAAEDLEDSTIGDAWDALLATDGAANEAGDDWSDLTREIANHVYPPYPLPNMDRDVEGQTYPVRVEVDDA